MATTFKTVPKARKPVTSWSFSRYMDYRKCPALFAFKHLDKIAEPKNDAMLRGSGIHQIAENYIKGKDEHNKVVGPKIPMELAAFEDVFKKLRVLYKKRTAGIIVEDDWAFTNSWDRTKWDDWVNCWVRIKLDCSDNSDPDILVIRDWKTGKYREERNEEYMEQMDLYALAGLLLHPHVKEVHPELVYLDVPTVYPPADKPVIYTQADVPRLKKEWLKRVTPMFKDKRYAPRANSECRWCWFGQSGIKKGGPGLCKF